MPSSGTVISPGQRSKIAPRLVMVVICLGFFALWLRDLGYPSLSGDESFVLNPQVVMHVREARMYGPMWRTVTLSYDPGFSMSSDEWLGTLHRELSRFLTQHAGPTDVFGLNTPDAAPCYYARYYFDRDLGCELLPRYPTQPPDELKGQMDRLLSEHSVLWYLDFYNPYWDPNRVADEALAERAVSLGTETVEGGRLRLFTSTDAVQRDQRRVRARFGEVAELDGVWLVRGSSLHVVLVWRALADHPAVAAKVFVHLVDQAGQVVAQADGVPVGWTRPLDTWRFGEQTMDVYTLELPDAVSSDGLTLRTGLYDPDTLKRFLAADRSGARLADDAVSVPLGDVSRGRSAP